MQSDSGRHDFISNSSRPTGPNVFHDSVTTSALDESGPHQRWITGGLYDNIVVQGDQINLYNRGYFGTGHGWAGANHVIYNSGATGGFIVQNPPTAQNWLIGSVGPIVEDDRFGEQPPGNIDAHGSNVGPPSLYETQLDESRPVEDYHWAGGGGEWSDPAAWAQGATPLRRVVQVRDYLLGDIDGFTHDGPGGVDDPAVDPQWADFIAATSANPITGFDDLSGNANVAFTASFGVDPGDVILHAYAALSMRQAGGLVGTDFIRLFDDAPEHRFAFADLGWDTQVNPDTPFVGVIDLGAKLDRLQAGTLNVQLNDDTAADWFMLNLTVLAPVGDGAGARATIDRGGHAILRTAIAPLAALTVGDQAGGELTVAPGGVLPVSGGITVGHAAPGRLTLAGGVMNALGTLALGPEGELAVEGRTGGALLGALDAEPGARLRFEPDAAGLTTLSITGDAQLDGAVLVLGGPAPDPGTSFDLLTAASIDAAGLTLDPTSAAWSWAVADAGSQQVLRATYTGLIPGDLNGDGFVGAADLDLLLGAWNQSPGPGAPADLTGDGFIGAADLDVLLGNWSLGRPPAAAAVPEPASALLLAAALVGLTLRR